MPDPKDHTEQAPEEEIPGWGRLRREQLYQRRKRQKQNVSILLLVILFCTRLYPWGWWHCSREGAFQAGRLLIRASVSLGSFGACWVWSVVMWLLSNMILNPVFPALSVRSTDHTEQTPEEEIPGWRALRREQLHQRRGRQKQNVSILLLVILFCTRLYPWGWWHCSREGALSAGRLLIRASVSLGSFGACWVWSVVWPVLVLRSQTFSNFKLWSKNKWSSGIKAVEKPSRFYVSML